MNKELRSIPIEFKKKVTYEAEDKRFMKVEIWLMHLGENFNGSYFAKEYVEEALPSLANTPILAYMEENEDGELDFSDHRMELVIEDNDVKLKYMGQAIGVIPEDNNARFEKKMCDDGIEREFVVCDGLIWTKFDDPMEIFERQGTAPQSMELDENFEGEFKDGLFHFTNFKFFGACLLGENVTPAMQNAIATPQFSQSNLDNHISKMVAEYKSVASFSLSQGGIELDKNELLTKYSLTKEDLVEKNIDMDALTYEELEEKLQAFASTDEENKPEENGATQNKEENPADDTTKDENETKPETEFAMANSQITQELRAQLYAKETEDEWGYKWHRYWYVDHDSEKVIATDEEDNGRLVAFSYTTDGDKVNLDLATRQYCVKKYEFTEEPVEADFISSDFAEYKSNVELAKVKSAFAEEKELEVNAVKSDLDKVNENFAALENEVAELRTFKTNKLAEDRKIKEDALFEQFSSELDEDEIKEFKAMASDFSIESLEEKLYVAVGKKKAKFSKKQKQDDSIKIPVDFNEKPQYTKSWGHLVEQYTSK
ncbi:hypothetical protein PQ478_08505 [Alkalihalophilus pseudofirmus]|uniref:hypothetical protein n=1 Tax=Alkalihalophilus pseudofirmus TaxID=79885 RepID=UPI00259B7A4A|nr:hypothetical protein [Alkalihalophilus pseudofirmus]WEG18509.1 hypothetical protein PQ478_08505 [Alkalihalophilus pseudofirmus]